MLILSKLQKFLQVHNCFIGDNKVDQMVSTDPLMNQVNQALKKLSEAYNNLFFPTERKKKIFKVLLFLAFPPLQKIAVNMHLLLLVLFSLYLK